MTYLRTAALVLFAVLVPGGLVVLVPTVHRLFIDLRNKRRERTRVKPATAHGEAGA